MVRTRGCVAGLTVVVAVLAVHLGAVSGGGFRKFSLSELEEAAKAREDREGLRDVSISYWTDKMYYTITKEEDQ